MVALVPVAMMVALLAWYFAYGLDHMRAPKSPRARIADNPPYAPEEYTEAERAVIRMHRADARAKARDAVLRAASPASPGGCHTATLDQWVVLAKEGIGRD